MNRRFLITLLSLLVAAGVRSQPAEFYINDVVLLAPPATPPQIDALNFINNNYFDVELLFSATVNAQLYDTSSTINFSNAASGTLIGNPGFRFDTAPATVGLRRPAASFVNDGLITVGSLNNPFVVQFGQFFGTQLGLGFVLAGLYTPKVIVEATNLTSHGVIDVGVDGLVTLKGNDVDLSRSVINMDGFENSLLANVGIFDNYWGVGTAQRMSPAGQFGFFPPSTPVHIVTQLFDRVYFTLSTAFFVNATNAFVNDWFTTPTNEHVQAVFVGNSNPDITNRVYFLGGPPGPPGTIVVEWENAQVSPITGAPLTNHLYLLDSMDLTTNLVVLTNNLYSTVPSPTFRPTNFFFTRFRPFLFRAPATPTTPPFFPALATNDYSAYSVLLQPTTVIPTNVAHQSLTNLPGRIEINASDALDLNYTRILGLNYLSLKSTNHFLGNTNSDIIAPFTDLELSTTNGFLAITNLIQPNVPRFNGEIDVYAAHWTNSDTVTGIETIYHVLLVNSDVSPTSPSLLENLRLRTKDLVVSDVLNVTDDFLLDVDNLLLTSNTNGAASARGEINLLSARAIWSSATPHLKTLTNNGAITTSANAIFFGGRRTTPYFSGGPSDWYLAFVNHGIVTNHGTFIYANYFENTGLMDSGIGSFTLQSLNALMTNGAVTALGAISLSSGSLVISNHSLTAGGPISIGATNFLDDGSLFAGSPDLVTNKNFWTASGFNILSSPGQGSLLGTTIYNSAQPFQKVVNRTAAVDRGCNPEGFVNNAAVGRMILDGGLSSLFEFASAGGQRAIYIDSIEMLNATATNRDAAGTFYGISADPNTKVYFGQALANGVQVSEKLNGQSGGRFCWVSGFNCGFFSSTNLLYPNGTTNRVNTALAQACDIDTDGDGIVNCLDPDPIPGGGCVLPPGGGGNGGGGNGGGGGSANGHPTLDFPTKAATTGTTGTVASAKGTYNGLFYDTNGVATSSSGYLTVKTTARGTFTGKLFLGGLTYNLSGKFNPDGLATISIPRPGTTNLTVQLRLDLSGANQISGHIGSENLSAEVLSDLVGRPALAGNYTLVIPGDVQDATAPGGDGFGTLKVTSAGSITFKGTLGDGTKVSQGSTLSKQAIWPLYSSLYGGSGSIVSWIQFTNQAQSDLNGQLIWTKAASASTSYPRGFTNEIVATGSAYKAPARGKRVLDLAQGQLVLSGGGLAQSITNNFTLNPNNKITAAAGSKVSLSITTSTGLFKGSVANPATGAMIPFQGVLLKKANIGVGYFIGAGLSGEVYLSPGPVTRL